MLSHWLYGVLNGATIVTEITPSVSTNGNSSIETCNVHAAKPIAGTERIKCAYS